MAIAALATLLLYQIYVFGRSNKQHPGHRLGRLSLLPGGQLVFLLLNRTREYMADHYSAQATGAPDVLSSALVKIACGLVRSDGEYTRQLTLKKADKKSARQAQRLSGALGVMGISNVQSAPHWH